MEYKPQRRSGDPPHAPFIFLLVLKDENGKLNFLAHPQWRTLVQPEDSEYVESLLADLPVRAKTHPDALFDQLCSLSVGPLETKQIGQSISEHPTLAKLISTFEPV
jgi:hypothetical protein